MFDDRSRLDIEIEADFRALTRNRDASAQWQEARLTFTDAAGAARAIDVGVRGRGRYRLERDNCRFPPLFVDFAGRATDDTPFSGQRQLPLATHCRDSARYEQYVVLEYLAYRAYELVSPRSMRVRPARITYTDSGSGGRQATRFAFFIEHFDTLAARHGAEIVEIKPFNPADGAPLATIVLDVFQHMIGNTDWSEVYQHNILLLREADGAIMPVAYDFDFSGLVNASYAKPPEHLRIRSVRQRLYRGVCWPLEQMLTAFELFHDRREQVYQLFRDQPELEPGVRQRSIEYLEDFYEMIASPEQRQKEVIDACRDIEL